MVGNSSEHKQSVSFRQDDELATIALEIESIYDLSEDDKKDIWFSRSDYHFSRSSARVIAKESERYGHSKHLDCAFITAHDQHVQDRLNLWCLHGSSRRGLERWANSAHGDLRKDDQCIHVRGVIRAQTEMRLKGEDDLKQETRLRDVSEILSLKSRLFAQMIGEADANAAKWEFGMTEIPELLRPSSPRQILKQTKQVQTRMKNLGLGGPTRGSRGRRAVARTTSVPNLRGVGSTLPAASRNSTSSPRLKNTSPRLSIRTRPGRVPRMA